MSNLLLLSIYWKWRMMCICHFLVFRLWIPSHNRGIIGSLYTFISTYELPNLPCVQSLHPYSKWLPLKLFTTSFIVKIIIFHSTMFYIYSKFKLAQSVRRKNNYNNNKKPSISLCALDESVKLWRTLYTINTYTDKISFNTQRQLLTFPMATVLV